MSLINDALKRATETKTAGKPGEDGSPMLPVDSHRSISLPAYFVPVLLAIFCGGLWFFTQGLNARRSMLPSTTPMTVAARESSALVADASQPAIELLADLQATVELDPAAATPGGREFTLSAGLTPQTTGVDPAGAPASAQAPPTAATVVPAPPAEVPFRLQGIFYRPADPSAVINNKTCFIGDLIAGGRVKAIERQAVTIERDGKTTVLTLQ